MDHQQDEIMRALGRIEGRIDSFLTTQAQHYDRINQHDNRISKLERARAWLIGAAAAAGAGSAKLLSLVGLH